MNGLDALPDATRDRIVVDRRGCWRWTGTRNGDGYGSLSIDGKSHCTHRWVFERLVGAIPEGHDIDHLCRVRDCVNPDHLEPVTRRENLHRSPFFAGGGWKRIGAMGAQTTNALLNKPGECRKGHEKVPENGYIRPDGTWQCRICHRARKRTYRAAGGVH